MSCAIFLWKMAHDENSAHSANTFNAMCNLRAVRIAFSLSKEVLAKFRWRQNLMILAMGKTFSKSTYSIE